MNGSYRALESTTEIAPLTTVTVSGKVPATAQCTKRHGVPVRGSSISSRMRTSALQTIARADEKRNHSWLPFHIKVQIAVKFAMLPSLLYLIADVPSLPPQLPPGIVSLQTPEFGARGPLHLCSAGLAIDALDGEGVHVIGAVLRVINDDYLIAITPLPEQDRASTGRLEVPISLKGGLVALRYDGATLPGNGEPSLAMGSVRYEISADAEMDESVIVGSSAFDGSASDQAILSRLRLAGPGEAGCVRPLSFTSDQFGDAASARRAGFESTGVGQSIALYPAKPFAGPGFHCQGGIGFSVEPGESLLRPWKPLGDGTSYLTHDGTTIKISGPNTPMGRADPQDHDEHPMSLLHETRIIYYRSRGVGPPYAPPGVREDGSWSIELGREINSRMEIAFPASEKTGAGFRFLERLEFVSKDEPRCNQD